MGQTEFNWNSATPEERRALWIKKLRSGEYQQGTGLLRHQEEFCCLGVLCDLADKSRWLFDQKFSYYLEARTRYDTLPPDSLLADVGLSEADASSLADLNDGGSSFEEIATAIERQDYSGDLLIGDALEASYSAEDEAA